MRTHSALCFYLLIFFSKYVISVFYELQISPYAGGGDVPEVSVSILK